MEEADGLKISWCAKAGDIGSFGVSYEQVLG